MEEKTLPRSREAQGGDETSPERIVDSYALSPMQEGLLLETITEPHSRIGIWQLNWDLREELNLDAFEGAWRRAVERHPALRTRLRWEDVDEPVQEVVETARLPFEVFDWRELSADAQREQIDAWHREDRRRGLDLNRSPLFRVTALRLADAHVLAVVTIHHAIFDGRSLLGLVREVFGFYESLCGGEPFDPPPPNGYRLYIDWLAGRDMARAEAFWRAALGGFEEPTPLSIGHGTALRRRTVAGDERARAHGDIKIHLDEERTAALVQSAKSRGMTLNTLFLAACGWILARYANRDEAVFGVVRTNRSIVEGGDSVIGPMMNSMPFRVRMPRGAGVEEWLESVRSHWLDMRPADFVRLSAVQEWSGLDSGVPLFENLVLFEKHELTDLLRRDGGAWMRRSFRYVRQPRVPLSFYGYQGARFELKTIFDSRRFDHASARRLLGHLRTLLEALPESMDAAVADLPMLTAVERQQLLVEWNDVEPWAPERGPRTVVERFAWWARQTPRAQALEMSGAYYNYGELDARSDQLALALRRLGVERETLVACCMRQSAERIVAFLAILKAGGAYVPLEPGDPIDRLSFLLADCRTEILLIDRDANALRRGLGEGVKEKGGRVPRMVAPEDLLTGGISWDSLPAPPRPEHLAYVIYTSGSTGRPKGVALSHGGVVDLLCETGYVDIRPSDRMAQISNVAFDAATFEIWGALLNGAALVGVDRETAIAPEQFAHALERDRISTALIVTPIFHQLVERIPSAVGGLRYLAVGGDALDPAAVARVLEAGPPERFQNLYGPTESTVVGTAYTIERAEARHGAVSIGGPIGRTRLHVVSRDLRPQAAGIPGELLLGGPRLARGYLRRPGLTAERFIPDPFAATPGERLYRTGDLVYHRHDGALEFLGRIDHQVKLRGFRIELGEIQSVLETHPSVRECVVLLHEDEHVGRRLVAWVVSATKAGMDPSRLESFLIERLPHYMVPTAFVGMESFPRLPSGKLDRAALPAPEMASRAFIAPRDPFEERLADIWRGILGVERVGRHDNFFELGGHSLLAIRACSLVREAFEVDLPHYAFFEAASLEELAREVQSSLPTQEISVLVSLEQESLELSVAQRRLWFLDQLVPGNPFYNVSRAWWLRGELRLDALRAAFGELVRRHAVLRTRFPAIDGEPVQSAAPPEKWALGRVDFRGLPSSESDQAARRWLARQVLVPFDLVRDLPFRVVVAELGRGASILLLTLHHIAADGWSMNILTKELRILYETACAGHDVRRALGPLRLRYADFAAWQRRWLSEGALDNLLRFWTRRLEGSEPVELPYDRPPSGGLRRFRGRQVRLRLSDSVRERLEHLNLTRRLTPFTTTLSAFLVFVGRLSGRRDLLIGSALAGRHHVGVEGLVGFFVNSTPLRGTLDAGASFAALLEQMRRVTRDAQAYQDVPLDQLVERLGIERVPGRNPLFEIIFGWQSAEGGLAEFGDLRGETIRLPLRTTRFDLEVHLEDSPESLELSLVYDRDLFDETTVRRWAEMYSALLDTLVENPEAPFEEAGRGRPPEGRQIVLERARQVELEWCRTPSPHFPEQTVATRFLEIARARPDAAALVSGERLVSYGELARRSGELASRLRAWGVGPEVPVGLGLGRSIDLVTSILAVLRAGGWYAPLDPSQPVERLAFLLEDCGAGLVLTCEEHAATLRAAAVRATASRQGGTARIVQLDAASDLADPVDRHPDAPDVSPDNLAYVMYTSGSTGRPKGVAVAHRSILRLVLGSEFIDFGPDETYLLLAPPAFDASTLELWGSLLHGSRLVIFEPARPSLDELGDLLERERITTAWLTAGLFHQMVDHAVDRLGSLRRLLAGGDVLSASHLRRMREHHPATLLVNGYGPTENVTFTTCHRMGPGEAIPSSVPVGRPIGWTSVWVMDDSLRPSPQGAWGELLTGGAGLSRGYLGRPSLTAERFVPSPSGSGERLYRTGDRVRWRADGVLEFQGRMDDQVKLRGFRVEPGEVRAVVQAQAGVADSAVVVRELAGSPHLVAYVVAEASPAGALLAADPSSLRERLAELLPEHLVPTAYVALERLPLTSNGKLDRRALPEPELGASAETFTAPRTAHEEQIAGVWAEVLGLERVSVHDSFFGLGGHSLLAARMVARLRRDCDLDVSLVQLFSAPTVAELAEALAASDDREPPIDSRPRVGRLPLSHAQERIWWLDRLHPGSALYNIPLALDFLAVEPEERGARLDVEALRRALGDLIDRHEPLRTTIHAAGAGGDAQAAAQTIQPSSSIGPPRVELGALRPADRDAQAARLLRVEGRRGFDLSRAPLRLVLLRLDAARHRLLFLVHHIAFDGASLPILLRDLGAFYRARRAGAAAELEPLAVHYGDYARRQRQWMRGARLERRLASWREMLADLPTLELPLDHPRPAAPRRVGRLLRFQLPGAEAVEALCEKRDLTPFMVVLAVFQVALARLCGQRDTAVCSPVAGRTRPELDELIGFFVNTLVLRSRMRRDDTFLSLLERMGKVWMEALAKQDLPFNLLVEDLAPDRSSGSNPLSPAAFVLQSPVEGLAEEGAIHPFGDLRVRLEEGELGTAKFDLLLSLRRRGEGYAALLEYDAELFDHATMQRLAGILEGLYGLLPAAPATRLAEAPVLTAAQRRQIELEWCRTPSPRFPEQTVATRFLEIAEARPDAAALVSGERVVSYGELARRSGELASRLRAWGVGPEVPVGLGLGRSIDLVTSILAVLRAGGWYAPLDPSQPVERLAFLLEDCGAGLVLTCEEHGAALRAAVRTAASRHGGTARIVQLDAASDLADPVDRHPDAPDAPDVSPDNLAYVMYTSGSTGHPKGVAVAHRSILRLVLGSEFIDFGPEETYLLLAPPAFDASTLELWGSLLHGSRLVIFEPARPSLDELGDLLERERITTAWLTAGLFHQMVDHAVDRLGSLRQLLAGGDVLSASHLRRMRERHPATLLVNGYGPTENVTFTTCHRMGPGEAIPSSVPVGRPIGWTSVWVMDDTLRPSPQGAWGELLTGGAGLSRGYLGRPSLTAERFVPSPSGSGERLYRTGDRVRWRADGVLEFQGRLDDQVKLRGFRVEPGEVRAVVQAQAGVVDSAVVVRELAGSPHLVAYVVAEASPAGERLAADPALLRERLAELLPEHLVPTAYVALDRLPLTSNGKLDRRALPEPELGASAETFTAPRTAHEEQIAGVWAEVLGLERVSVHDSFFELGGHSLAAMQVLNRLRSAFGVDLALRTFFEAPDLAALAREVETARRVDAGLDVLPPIERFEGASAPLSFNQERLWFLDRLEPDNPAYHLPIALALDGPLDLAALHRALDAVTARRDVLRTCLVEIDGEPRQVESGAAPDRRLVDLERLPRGRRSRVAEGLLRDEARRPFALDQGPLLRVRLVRLEARRQVLLLAQHHVISDGASVDLLLDELGAAYDAASAGRPRTARPPSMRYADFAAWQRSTLRGDALERRLTFWRGALEGIATLELAADRPRPASQAHRGEIVRRALSPELAARVDALARSRGATRFMTLLTVFEAVLFRWSETRRFAVGTTIANRRHPQLEELVGFCANTLALPAELDPEEGLGRHLETVRAAVLDAHAHQDMPFELLVDLLQPERELSRSPLFQVMFVERRMSPPKRWGKLAASVRELDFGVAKFDLGLGALSAPDGGLTLSLEFDRDLFDRVTGRRLLDHFERLLDGWTARPELALGAAPLLSRAESHQLVHGWNDLPASPSPPDAAPRTLHGLFAARALGDPDGLALLAGEIELTAGELAARAAAVARRLRELGLRPEERVGICLHRTPRLIEAMLGVLAAGGAYLPLDPAYPLERLSFTLNDAGARWLLSSRDLAETLPAGDAEVIFVDDLDLQGAEPDLAEPVSTTVHPEQAAYVIYTSGSTGRPKGVVIEHRAAVALLDWARQVLPDGYLADVGAATSVCFDLSIFEIFAPLAWGGRIHLLRDALELAERGSTGAPRPFNIALLNTVPSAMAELVRMDAVPTGVAAVILAGEPLPADLAEALYALPGMEAVYNCYGPSEDTTYSTWSRVPPGTVPTLGRPLHGSRLYLLDRRLAPTPAGRIGEICLAGAGLSRGYLGRPGGTAASFAPDPFGGSGERLYRTGDLARARHDGEILFLGRRDHQVKVRGFRVELGEIEESLRRHPRVRDAVVVAWRDGGGDRLAAYVEAGGLGGPGAASALAAELRRFLAERLPGYMVPAALRPMADLPRTPNGKIDRARLPRPEVDAAAPERGEIPVTPLEELVAGVWSEVLEREAIGRRDDFFSLGGHSLSATRVVSRLRETVDVDIPLRDFFEAPTVAALARRIDALRRSDPRDGDRPTIPPLARGVRPDRLPLAFAQQRMWFLDRLAGGDATYNIPAVLHLDGELDVDALRRALRRVGRAHEILRTRIAVDDDGPRQMIDGEIEEPLRVLDLRGAADPEAEAASRARELALQPFDLERRQPLRSVLLRLGATRWRWVTAFHHAAADWWSLGLFFREVSARYAAALEEGAEAKAAATNAAAVEPELAGTSLQFADFALWQRRWLQGDALEHELHFWRQALGGLELLDLPTDRPRPAVRGHRGGRITFRWPEALRDALADLGRRRRATPFMLIVAAFQALLARLSGQGDVALGVPVANRHRVEVEGLIGCFINTLVLRGRAEDDPDGKAWIDRVRGVVLDAYAHQDLPFEALVDALSPDRDLGATPFFRVLFTFQNEVPSAALAGLESRLEPIDTGRVKLDLDLAMGEDEEGLLGRLSFAAELFDAVTARRTAGQLRTLLEGLTADPERRLSELPLLEPSAERQILEWCATAVPETSPEASPETLIHRRFETWADADGAAPALLAIESSGVVRHLDRRALDTAADRLAWRLIERGVGPERVVGICAHRGPSAIVALLAVLKAGGAYLFLDPEHPAARRRAVLMEAAAALLLADASGADAAPEGLEVLRLDAEPVDAALAADEPVERPRVRVEPEHPAYVLFTSGSTGRPKGVVVEHRQATAYVDGVAERLALPEGSSFAAVSTLAADLGNTAIFTALCGGGVLHLIDRERAIDPEALARHAGEHPYDALKIVPSHLAALLGGADPRAVLPRRLLVVGGETCPPDLIERVRELAPACRILNHYGPTETTVGVATHEVRAALVGPPPLGRPLRHARGVLLDRRLRLVPVGVPGEICLGGDGLARGYLESPGRTAERFVPSPLDLGHGERLYRTGDRGRFLGDGTLEFLGRLDHQVKIRGFRLELGEIEAVLRRRAEVAEAVVLAVGERAEARLVAFVVAPPEIDLSTEALREALRETLRDALREALPSYMVPAIRRLGALPLNANGKLDRRALEALAAVEEVSPPDTAASRSVAAAPPEARPGSAAAVAERAELRRRIAAIWRRLLAVERVGERENFFDLGGHSLLLIQVQRALREELEIEVPVVDLFSHPTVESLARRLAPAAAPLPAAPRERRREERGAAIAVVGLSGRFPGAADVDTLWRNLLGGVESIRSFDDGEHDPIDPVLRAHPNYVNARGVLDDVDLFDAAFFGFRPREAALTDPQHRVFLECAHEALEDAGCDPRRFDGLVGVYAGVGRNAYFLHHVFRNPALGADVYSLEARIGNDKDFLPTRVAYKLDLRGPGVAVQSSCSTSLVAVHLACRGLLDGDCDLALAGGVRISFPQHAGYLFQEGGISSPDGHCRAFDADARGVVPGNGAAVVALKRLDAALADGDAIHAVIRGSAINNDGGVKIGYTAPSADGQARVIRDALAAAEVEPSSIGYLEAHGTGTELGDPIEIDALRRVFADRPSGDGALRIGSVKTNLGHLDTAAGATGLIKAILAVRHGEIPPSLHFERPNPRLGLDDAPFEIAAERAPWPLVDGPRRAGVSSFGIGGTNAHVVVEQPPAPRPASEPSRGVQLLPLSARTPKALADAATRLADHLESRPEDRLADVAHTLQIGRGRHAHRFAVVAADAAEAVAALRADIASTRADDEPSVVFLLPGQGAQYPGMGAELYAAEPVFRRWVDEGCEILRPELGLDLRELLFAPPEQHEAAAESLARTRITQPALFVVEYALARQWMAWGVRPTALVGHSIGEYVAACLAGVFSFDAALRLVAARGRLVEEQPGGAMLAVALPVDELAAHLDDDLEIAALNAPRSTVAAGPAEAIERLRERLAGAGIEHRPLKVSHAFHSRSMEGAMEPFERIVESVDLRAPEIPFISCAGGTWIGAEEAVDPAYWARQLRLPVRFAPAIETLLGDSEASRVLLEVGPGRTLGTLAKRVLDDLESPPPTRILASLRHPKVERGDVRVLVEALGRLWASGVEPDWQGFHGGETRRRVHLPTYPFQRSRYWVEPTLVTSATTTTTTTTSAGGGLIVEEGVEAAAGGGGIVRAERGDLSVPYRAPESALEERLCIVWSELFGVARVGVDDDFFELGGDSLLATQLAARLRDADGLALGPAEIMARGTVASLAAALGPELAAVADGAADTATDAATDGTASGDPATDLSDLADLLDSLDDMSSEEVEQRIATLDES